MAQIALPESGPWVMLGWGDPGDTITILYDNADHTVLMGTDFTPLQRRIMAMRLKGYADLIDPVPAARSL